MTSLASDKIITLSPSGRQFQAVPGRSILEAGLSSGLALPFRCANGSCGDCRARLLEGSVQKIQAHEFVLSENEKADNHFLLCACSAETDVTLEVVEAVSVEDIPMQELLAKRCQFEHAEGVTLAGFKFLRGKALRFLPGQQAKLEFTDGFSTTLHIASCPCNAQYVEFHLADDQLGTAARQELESRIGQMKSVTKISVSGPVGRFTLSPHTEKAKVFIAVGGGFGKLQGLIEHVFNLELGVPCCLVWQATEQTGHYHHNLCRSWDDAVDEFSYFPAGSDADVVGALRQWPEDLVAAEFYLADFDNSIISALQHAGVSLQSILYPPEPESSN